RTGTARRTPRWRQDSSSKDVSRGAGAIQSVVRLPGALSGSCLDQVNDEHDRSADQDPGELIPREERNAREPRLYPVIGRHTPRRGEGNDEKKPRPITQPAAMRLFSCHDAIPLARAGARTGARLY